MATSTPGESPLPLRISSLFNNTNKEIADLREDVRRLSEDLKTKDALLTACLDVAHNQSLRISSLSAAFQDTAPWDPAACPRPSSCSTPVIKPPWTEVVCGRKRASGRAPSPPALSLSNRFNALSESEPVVASAAHRARPASKQTDQPSSRKTIATARRKLLRDAVVRRSGGLHCLDRPNDNVPQKQSPQPNGSQGLKRGVECLRSQTALLILIGFLASICANIVLTVLLIGRPVQGAPPDPSSLGFKLNSMQRRYIQLCEDYTTLGQSCSKTVKQCSECPDGWRQVGDQCYHFSSNKLDWLKSRDSCAEMGSHLAILHTMEQHDELEKEAKRVGGFDYHFWIGLSDIEKEGDWRWVDNTTLQYKFWDQWSSEPNNHQSGGVHGEDCATLDSHAKTWFDVPCEHIYKRICQMDAIQLN